MGVSQPGEQPCGLGLVLDRIDRQRMAGDLATWRTKLPERSRFAYTAALRQTLGAAVRWGYITSNPMVLAGRNPQPPPRTIRVYTNTELDAIAAELSPALHAMPAFVAATGLRPEEWAALERRDIDRRTGVLTIARTISDGKIVDLGKTTRSRRQVPLSKRALDALDATPAQLKTPLIFPAPAGGPINLDNLRRREWAPAIEASGIATPARIYDLRCTFASRALAAGIGVFELARLMGSSVRMIERHYGALLDGSAQNIASRLDAFDAAENTREEDAASES
jgi:integrase